MRFTVREGYGGICHVCEKDIELKDAVDQFVEFDKTVAIDLPGFPPIVGCWEVVHKTCADPLRKQREYKW